MFTDAQYEAVQRLNINIVVLPKGVWHIGEGSEAWCGQSGTQVMPLSSALNHRRPCERCARRLRAHGTTMNAVRAALYDRALGWPAGRSLNVFWRHIGEIRHEGEPEYPGEALLNWPEVRSSEHDRSGAARAMLVILDRITAGECTAQDAGFDEAWVREQLERLRPFVEGRGRWLLDPSRLSELTPEERECVFYTLYELAVHSYSGTLIFPPDGPRDAIVIDVSGREGKLASLCSGLPYRVMEEVAPETWSRWVPDDGPPPKSLLAGDASDTENQGIPLRWRHTDEAKGVFFQERYSRGVVQERATMGHAYEGGTTLCGESLRVLRAREASGWVPAIDVTCRKCTRELQERGVDPADRLALLRWYHANEQVAQIHADLSDYAWNVLYESDGWRNLELGKSDRQISVFLEETASAFAAAGRDEESEIFRGLAAAMQPNGSIEISLRRFLVRVTRRALRGVDLSNFLMTDRGVEILGPDHLLAELRDAALPPRRAEPVRLR